ncbi:MAG: dephospho-CoA kinase [Armatimonadetes bacterium]|nr:dephospho-CoA kinase [Armatimonadota bacterium]
MFLIGLTGTIASGKSTVAKLLAERGAEVIDSDLLAREATAPGAPALVAIRARFGSAVFGPQGSLDRAALARLVFADAAALADLEAIIHPQVRALRDQRLAASPAKVAVIEAIKLFEAGIAAECDTVWVVTAAETVRLERLVTQRGMPLAEAQRRLAAQGDFAAQTAAAAVVIVNDGDLQQLRAQVDRAWAATVEGR